MLSRKLLMYYSQALSACGTVNVLLVSASQYYLDELGKNLYITHHVQQDERTYPLKVHTSKTVLDVLEYLPDEFCVDFIGLILDVRVGNCLEEVKENLLWIDPCFPREKICLINPNSAYQRSMISPSEIWEFAKDCQMNLINGKMKSYRSLFNLSMRILNVIEGSCGLHNGIPMVNVV